MTRTFPTEQQAPSEVLAVPRPAGAAWYLALATALALAGFFLGRGTAPEKTVTKTVQVSAPPYTTSSTVKATVVFDGTAAAYHGPAEVKSGTVVNFTLSSKQPDALLVVGRVDPGITWEQAFSYTSTGQPSWLSDVTTSIMNVKGVTTATLTDGVYLVAVLTSPSSTNRAYDATMIRVTR